jgi:putative ABC transport system substrate-binding protein
MERRAFIIKLAGGIGAMPFAARAQQTTKPTIGFLRSTPSAPFGHLVSSFREGLGEIGFIDGQNVLIEYRWANNQLDRLPNLATELVSREVAVIVGNSLAVEAAKAATTTIPIVFVTSDDPVARGLVGSLGRPGGNLTGITFFGGGQLAAKRLELLREFVPKAATIAFLMVPNWPGSDAELPDVQVAARAIGVKIVVVRAGSERDLEPAFAAAIQAGANALVVSGSPLFTSQRQKVVALAARHRVPAIYDVREHAASGGLMSYSASLSGAYRQAGVYAGQILKGAKPAELPVLQPNIFELTINLKTAEALGLTVPQTLLLRADELIQ